MVNKWVNKLVKTVKKIGGKIGEKSVEKNDSRKPIEKICWTNQWKVDEIKKYDRRTYI